MVSGDGAQTCSFCYLDDLIDGLVMLMASAGELTGPVNLGISTEITVLELAERIVALTNSCSPIVRKP